MKNFTISLILSIISTATMAQQGTISGKVTDNKQEPLAGATVQLLHLPDSAKVAAIAADADGAYHFTKIAAGKYMVKAALVSYPAVSFKVILVDGQAVTVPTLVLVEQKRSLKEVTVSATIPQLVQKSDRLVVNVEKLNTTGDNALDVIKKAPGIRLDKDDNILYRNNAGVTVMIDGRLTYMSGGELSNYLKSLPGDALSKIELIANPPGNYDAEGTAGIVNIILKRNKAQGYNGSANLSGGYGKYGKVYGGANLNYNTGKFSFYTRANSGYFDSYNKLTLSRHIGDEVYNQLNYWHPKSVSTDYTVGADYRAGDRHTIGIMLKGFNDPTNAAVTSNSVNYDAAGQQAGSVTGVNPQKTGNNTYSVNLNYAFAIDTMGQKLSMDADYVTSNAFESDMYTNNYFDANGSLIGAPIQLRNNSPVNYNIKAIKADYVLPFGNHWQAETGAKSSWVSTHSNVMFDSLKTNGWAADPKRSNDFLYNENINAAYLTLGKTISTQWDVKASLRAEQTNSTANSMYGAEIVKRSYWQFFPSAFVTYKVNGDNQLNASYSRRISRPSYGSLNSAIRYTDPYTGIQGNPYLQPSISQSLVFNYTYKSFQILSLSYLNVDGPVNTVINQNDVTKESISTYQNLGKSTTVTATSAGTFNVVKWWTVNYELDGEYDKVNTMVDGTPYLNSRFSWSGNMDQVFILPKNYKLTLSSQYSSPSIMGLSRMLSASQIDAGISKTSADKRLTVSFKAKDIFFGSRWRSILQYNNVNTVWNNEWESRKFFLGLSYKFGNTKLKAARRRETGSSAEEQRM
ncbi:outer membrane beta-barrel family protein [Mucilaginibacter sp. dw_454]|uniref:outer membrane beta-barrel family protein n=1 Tax=Mucilaginibacter sp. dw_454 TaxID=2720079 RepID=UPI001BD1C5DE|nr:outer membrane beta-barrel family protein [Mucilaginibacter sp. dw_454]